MSNEYSYLTEWEVTESETDSKTHSETQSETQSDVTTDSVFTMMTDDQPPPSKKLTMALTKKAVVDLLKKKPLSISTMVSIIKTWNTGLSADEIGTKLEEILKNIPLSSKTLYGKRVLTLQK